MLQGFKAVFWVQFALAALLAIVICFVQAETRDSVLLSRRAKKVREAAGDLNYVARADEVRAPFGTMVKLTLSRPMRLLFTEPLIQAWTVYVSFACESLLTCTSVILGPALTTLAEFRGCSLPPAPLRPHCLLTNLRLRSRPNRRHLRLPDHWILPGYAYLSFLRQTLPPARGD